MKGTKIPTMKKIVAISLLCVLIANVVVLPASAAPLPHNGHRVYHAPPSQSINQASDFSGSATNLFTVKNLVTAIKDPFKGISINNIL